MCLADRETINPSKTSDNLLFIELTKESTAKLSCPLSYWTVQKQKGLSDNALLLRSQFHGATEQFNRLQL